MNRAQILEAVEALRQRKCRPEREAIAHHILKKHGTQFQDIFNDLETIVDEGGLVKVEYKGSISYRSPHSFAADTSPLLTKHAKVLNSNRTTRFILSAVTELLAENESYSKLGIPRSAINSKLIEYDSQRFSKPNTPDLLEREVTAGTLVPTTEDRLLPKDLHQNFEATLPNTPTPSVTPRMRGRKPNAGTKPAETTTVASPSISIPNLPESQSTSEIFAVKSLPAPVSPTTPTSSKPLRSYGRKSGTASAEKAEKDKDKAEEITPKKAVVDKKMPTLAISTEEVAGEVKNGDRMPNLVTSEEPSSGRSVRNKRKKEVFDPSDLPKKKPSVPTLVPTKEKEKPVSASKKATPTPPPPPRTKRPYRKRNKEAPVEKEPAPAVTVCADCKRSKNSRGQTEAFMVCSDCSIAYHPSCVGYDKKEASLLIENGTWLCFDCKSCEICQQQPVTGPGSIICSSCDGGFHLKCLKIRNRPDEEDWMCSGCMAEKAEDAIDDDKKETGKTTKEEENLEVASEVKEDEEMKDAEVDKEKESKEEKASEKAEVTEKEAEVKEEKEKEKPVEPPAPAPPPKKLGRPPNKKRIISLSLEKKVEPKEKEKEPVPATSAGGKDEVKDDSDIDIPLDASKWTPSQVEAYFKKHGLRDEGSLFKQQEIDGLALLLMRRQDIVHGMKLLLGPALKVFKLVVALQQSGGKVESFPPISTT